MPHASGMPSKRLNGWKNTPPKVVPLSIQTWIVHHLQILAEALTRIDESTRRDHDKIPWDKIRGMRNILVHEYFGIDKRLVWAVVESDLPELKAHLDAPLQQLS